MILILLYLDGSPKGDKWMALTDSERSAIARALAHGGGAAVRRLRYGVYAARSASRPGVVHTVTVDAAGAYGCDCEAGQHERVCWHQAAAYIAKVEHASGCRVVAPTVPPAPAPERPANVAPLGRAA
jgi:hypothetical protein